MWVSAALHAVGRGFESLSAHSQMALQAHLEYLLMGLFIVFFG